MELTSIDNNIDEIRKLVLDCVERIPHTLPIHKLIQDKGDAPDTQYLNLKLKLANIADTLDILNKVNLDTIDKSSTYKADLQVSISKVTAKFAKLTNEFKTIECKIVVDLANKYVAGLDLNNFTVDMLNTLHTKFRKYPVMISLWVNVTQLVIDAIGKQNKSAVYDILALITDDKYHVLEHNANNYFKNKSNIKLNPIPCRFGLIPGTICMNTADLCAVMFPGTPVTTTSWSKIAKEKSVGVIILNRILHTPIEFQVDALINKKDSTDQLITAGINKKTITRFTNLLPYTPNTKWDFQVEYINCTTVKDFYVVETLDGVTYRAMAPWMTTGNFKLSKARVQNILNYKPGRPSMATCYQYATISNAIHNMFVTKPLTLQDVEANATVVTSSTLQYDVTNDLMESILEILKTKYKNNISNSNVILSILHDEDIPKDFMVNMIMLFKKNAPVENDINGDTVTSLHCGSFKFNEGFATMIINLQKCTRRLVRELHNEYIRNPIDNSTFELKPMERTSLCVEKIKQVVDAVVKLVVIVNDNIYTSLQYKYLITNFVSVL